MSTEFLTSQMRSVVDAGIIDRADANEILEHFGLDGLRVFFRFVITLDYTEMLSGTVEATDEDEAHDKVADAFTGIATIKRKFYVDTRGMDDIETDAWSHDVIVDLDDEEPDFEIDITGEV